MKSASNTLFVTLLPTVTLLLVTIDVPPSPTRLVAPIFKVIKC